MRKRQNGKWFRFFTDLNPCIRNIASNFHRTYRLPEEVKFICSTSCSLCLHILITVLLPAQWQVKPEELMVLPLTVADFTQSEKPTRQQEDEEERQLQKVPPTEAEAEESYGNPEVVKDVNEDTESDEADALQIEANLKTMKPQQPAVEQTKLAVKKPEPHPDPPKLMKTADAHVELPDLPKAQVTVGKGMNAPYANFSTPVIPGKLGPTVPRVYQVEASTPHVNDLPRKQSVSVVPVARLPMQLTSRVDPPEVSQHFAATVTMSQSEKRNAPTERAFAAPSICVQPVQPVQQAASTKLPLLSPIVGRSLQPTTTTASKVLTKETASGKGTGSGGSAPRMLETKNTTSVNKASDAVAVQQHRGGVRQLNAAPFIKAIAIEQHTKTASVQPLQANSVADAIRGDLELQVFGKDIASHEIRIRVNYCQYPKNRHNKPMRRSERNRVRVVSPKEVRLGVHSAQAIIEDAPDGIYEFRGSTGAGNIEVVCTVTMNGRTNSPIVKRLGSKRLSNDSYIFRVLMPEGVIWEDDSAFNGSIEDSESITKYNSSSGVIWREFR